MLRTVTDKKCGFEDIMDDSHFVPGQPVSLLEMVDLLDALLEAPYALPTVRAALKRMEVPGEETHVRGGRGRFYTYDPVLCWVLATIYYRRDLRPEDLISVVRRRLGAMVPEYKHDLTSESGHRLAAAVHLSLITDPYYGMDVRTLWRLITAHPESLHLSFSTDDLLKQALIQYSESTVSWIASCAETLCCPSADETRRHFAHELGLLLQGRLLIGPAEQQAFEDILIREDCGIEGD